MATTTPPVATEGITAPTGAPAGTKVVEDLQVSRFAPFRTPAITVLNLGIFFVIWELVARAELVNPLFFPKISDTFQAMWEGFTDGTIPPQLWHSISNL